MLRGVQVAPCSVVVSVCSRHNGGRAHIMQAAAVLPSCPCPACLVEGQVVGGHAGQWFAGAGEVAFDQTRFVSHVCGATLRKSSWPPGGANPLVAVFNCTVHTAGSGAAHAAMPSYLPDRVHD